jgi:hypothetical protein
MRLSPSDPRYQEVFALQTMLHILCNPKMHTIVLRGSNLDSEVERNAAIAEIESKIQDIMDEDSPFYNFINEEL